MIRLILLILLLFFYGGANAQSWNMGKTPQTFGNNSPQIPVLAKWRFNADSGIYSFGRPVLKDDDTFRSGFIASKYYADSLYAAMLGYSAPLSHTHTISQVTGLQSALDSKLNHGDTTGKWIASGWLASLMKYPDTANLVAPYLRKSDTSGMLTNYLAHLNSSSNPHSVTKAQVGLGNADNTSDLNKPISTATQAALNLKFNISDTTGKWIGINQKGAATGVATLDGAGKVPWSQLPAGVFNYKGMWDAATNTPALSDGTGTIGEIYKVDVEGTQDLGSGNITFLEGEYAIHNGTSWERSGANDYVTSVNGYMGDVILSYLDVGAEGAFSKNSAFNKNFGAAPGTVAEGNDSRINNGQTAYSWGNHASVGYLTSYTETDPVFGAHVASGILSSNIFNWNTAYGWGDHALAGYLTSYTETDPVFGAHVASTILSSNIFNWNTAYGWGDHSLAGYLTSFTEVDPLSLHTSGGTVTGHIIGSYGANPLSISSYSAGNFEARVTDIEYAAGARAGYGFHNINVQGLYLYADADEKLRLRVPSGINVIASEGWVTAQNYLTSFTESDPVFGAHIASSILSSNIFNWNTAYGWGDHASVGYLTTESDPIYSASDAAGVTATLIGQWNTAFANNHTHANKALLDTYTQTETDLADAVSKKHSHSNLAVLNAITASYTAAEQTKLSGIATGAEVNVNADWSAVSGDAQILNKPTALSAFANDVGFITSYTETDPIFTASDAASVTNALISQWSTSYSWGNHASAGYLTSYTETDPVFLAHDASVVTSTLIGQWNTAYGWGNHASVGYLTSFTETDPLSILNGITPQTASYNITGTGTMGTLSVTGNGSLLGTDIYVPNIPNGSGNFVMLNSGYLHQRTPSQIISDLGLNSLYLQLAGGTMNTGANINMVGTDPVNGVIKFSNSNATSPHVFTIGAGLFGSHYQGWEIYDATAGVVRLYLNDNGNISVSNEFYSGSHITSGGYLAASSYIAATSQVYSSIGIFSNSSNANYMSLGSYASFHLNGGSAMGVLSGYLLTSDTYSDISNVPSNGIYSKGNVNTASNFNGASLYTYVPYSSGGMIHHGMSTGNNPMGFAMGLFGDRTGGNAGDDFVWYRYDDGGNFLGTNSIDRATGAMYVDGDKVATEAMVTSQGYTTNTGTVYSVAMTVPTGLTVSGSPITGAGTFAVGLQSGYFIPTNTQQGQWDAGYNYSQVGHLPLAGSSNITGSLVPLNHNTYDLGSTSKRWLNIYARNIEAGTSITVNGVNVLTGNQNITLSGDVTGSGATSITTTIANNAVATGKIANNAVTHAKYQQIATNTLLGNNAGGTANVSALTVSDVRAMLDIDGSIYSPTYTAVGNVAGITAMSDVKWVQNGDKITCYGKVEVEFTADGATTWRMDLPVTSNFVDITDAIGLGVSNDNDLGRNLRIQADPSTKEFRFDCIGVAGETAEFSFSVMYDIL